MRSVRWREGKCEKREGERRGVSGKYENLRRGDSVSGKYEKGRERVREVREGERVCEKSESE